MSTCNRLDLQTLGSQLIMPKNLPDHCFKPHKPFGFGTGFMILTGLREGLGNNDRREPTA